MENENESQSENENEVDEEGYLIDPDSVEVDGVQDVLTPISPHFGSRQSADQEEQGELHLARK